MCGVNRYTLPYLKVNTGFTVQYRKLWTFPGGAVVKGPPANAGDERDVSLIPGLEKPPGEGNGYPLQYSCLGKSHGWRNLVGYSSWGHRVGYD